MPSIYKRILLKLSGELLASADGHLIGEECLVHDAREIKKAHDYGTEIAIVVGGGNIYRGTLTNITGIDRVQGDYMGMLATVINAMALQAALEDEGLHTRVMSAIRIECLREPYIRRRALRHLEKHRVIIFAAGTGNPYFTTDSTASLKATEINADVVFKGTKVDGVYAQDPEKDRTAIKHDYLTFQEVYERNLQVMDMMAFTLCQENALPIVVCNILKPGNVLALLKGVPGTLIKTGMRREQTMERSAGVL